MHFGSRLVAVVVVGTGLWARKLVSYLRLSRRMVTYKEPVDVALFLALTAERIVRIAWVVLGVAPSYQIEIDHCVQLGFAGALAQNRHYFIVEWQDLVYQILLASRVTRKVDAHFYREVWQSCA